MAIVPRSNLVNGPVASVRDVVITHEDIDRAHDREQVSATRARRGFRPRLRLFWLLIGPGILVMLGENDGPSMLSYAATGARFGIGFFLPFVVLTFLMACVVQEMTVRLGAATHRGHAELIFDRFGPFWGWFSMIDLMVGNFLTLVTEFIAIRAGLGFFGVRPWVAVLGALLVLSIALMTHRYWTWERIILGAAMFNLVFVPVALLAHPHWEAVGRALATWRPLPGGITQETVLVLLADIGATVTPWMLFFQQSAIADKGLTTHDIRMGRVDTVLGAALATVAALATMLATAPLFMHHMSTANFEAAEFAQALQPFIGHWGAALFALGIFEAGMVAAITISTSSAYAFGEVARRPHSLNLPFRQGRSFYLVLLVEAAAAAGAGVDPGNSAGVHRAAGERDCRAGHASGAALSVHAGERSGNHGQVGQPAVGECAGVGSRDRTNRRRPFVWCQRDCAQCAGPTGRKINGKEF